MPISRCQVASSTTWCPCCFCCCCPANDFTACGRLLGSFQNPQPHRSTPNLCCCPADDLHLHYILCAPLTPVVLQRRTTCFFAHYPADDCTSSKLLGSFPNPQTTEPHTTTPTQCCCPADDYTSSKLLGSFLMMSQLQHTQPTSAMWLTGAAPNSLAIGLAHKQGVQLPASEQGVG